MTRKGPMRVPYRSAPKVPRYRLTLSGVMVLLALGLWVLIGVSVWLALKYA